jgi:predicted dithiol-disulfide oxidoreductase (DUF899 family)
LERIAWKLHSAARFRPGPNHRAGDLVDPVWRLLDMSPEGRGNFFPKLDYQAPGAT